MLSLEGWSSLPYWIVVGTIGGLFLASIGMLLYYCLEQFFITGKGARKLVPIKSREDGACPDCGVKCEPVCDWNAK